MKALISSISRLARKSLILTGIIALVMVVVITGTIVVLGRSDGQTFPGTTAVGSHEFWDRDEADAEFCTQCHATIAAEMVATATTGNHPLTTCLGCHPIAAGGHAAQPTNCVDCHGPASINGDEAAELLSADEAHNQLPGQLGEDATDLSWTCKACHTKVDVEMTTIPMGPLGLTQDQTD